jgi:hypothetical protein
MKLTSLIIELRFSNQQTATVLPGSIVLVEDRNGVRSRLVVSYLDDEEPKIMGTWNGTNLTGGCRVNQVVVVEKPRKHGKEE